MHPERRRSQLMMEQEDIAHASLAQYGKRAKEERRGKAATLFHNKTKIERERERNRERGPGPFYFISFV
jgi:hypothetical protein